MQPIFPYFTSAVLHLMAAAVMAWCVPPHMRWDVVVTKGKPIVTVMLAQTVSSEPPPVPIEADEEVKPQPTRPPNTAVEIAAQPVDVPKKQAEVAINEAKPEKAEPEKVASEVENMPPRKAPSREELVTEDGELPKVVVEKSKSDKVERTPTPTEIPDTETSAEKRDELAAQAVPVVKKPIDEKPIDKKTPQPEANPDAPKPTVEDLPPRRPPVTDEIVVVDSKPTKTPDKKTEKVKEFQVQRSAAMPYQASSELGAEVEMPRKSPNNPPPLYPQDALVAGIQGRVVLLVVVTAEGIVKKTSVETTSGHSVLDNAAMAAVANWRFEPARRRGLPIQYEVLVPVNFSIRRG